MVWFGFECERIYAGKMVDEFMPGVMILMFYLYNFLHNFLKLKTSIFPTSAGIVITSQDRKGMKYQFWAGLVRRLQRCTDLKFLDKMSCWAYGSGSELGKGVKGDT